MKGIVYVSKATVLFDGPKLTRLHNLATNRNAELGITRYLCFQRNRFVQYIEGEDQVCTDLMARIDADKRHDVLVQLADYSINERRFPSWSMRYLSSNDLGEVNLESLLSDALLHVDAPYGNIGLFEQSVWRLVESIANLQARLDQYFSNLT